METRDSGQLAKESQLTVHSTFDLAQNFRVKHKEYIGKIGMYQFDDSIGPVIKQAIEYYMSRRSS